MGYVIESAQRGIPMEFAEAQKHDVRISGPSLIKQAVQNRKHPLDMVREALSNSCAEQVGATKVILTIYKHPDYGATFSFFDDGIGMDYTASGETGRLNRFLNLGFSGVIGIHADEFGWKGLGAKLMYWCRQLTIETVSSKDRKRYRVDVTDPMGALEQPQPILPEPMVAAFPVREGEPSYTKITVNGYDGGRWIRDYELDKLKVYLFHRTIVGCTRKERAEKLPVIVLKHPDGDETPSPGYRFIQPPAPSPQSWRTVVIDPIAIRQQADDSKNTVEVILRGGFTLDTGSPGTEFSITPGNMNVGLNCSVLSIPYFPLDFKDFRGEFKPASKLCNFVVECDQLNLNMERSSYVADSISRAFEAAVRKAVARVKENKAYQDWVMNEEKLRREELSESLNDRKQRLQNPAQRWVYVDDNPIHVEPGNEKDTLAVLWKLEGRGKLPFYYFRSLQHTSLEGIDLICEYQEKKESQKRLFESVEVEFRLENYLDHDHVASQTGLIFCWDAKPNGDLKRVTDYEYLWHIQGSVVPVYVISKFPGIDVKPKT